MQTATMVLMKPASQQQELLTNNRSPVIWFSRILNGVSLSTTEAEHAAMTVAVKEVIWARDFLEEVGEKQEGPTPLFNDNSAAISLSLPVKQSTEGRST